LGLGTLALSGTAANANTGNTMVNAGTLLLAKTANVAAVNAGNLVINNGATVLAVLSDSQIGSGASVRLLPGGVFNLNDRSTPINDLSLVGTSVQTGGGTLTLSGSVHANASAAGNVISGILSLSAANHSFNVADGAAADDLLVSAVVVGGNGGTSPNVVTK